MIMEEVSTQISRKKLYLQTEPFARLVNWSERQWICNLRVRLSWTIISPHSSYFLASYLPDAIALQPLVNHLKCINWAPVLFFFFKFLFICLSYSASYAHWEEWVLGQEASPLPPHLFPRSLLHHPTEKCSSLRYIYWTWDSKTQ